ncbi:M56 family metallopeptidase [Sulfidibacter corallicola]|uniref:M56 family metallopeptidase n=1 Tax=Sulfidibacter corallicola TaxID=2818388 RepID=A0A8A4TKQ1_SULCO|nr:M56 family metallopeptidase [Sulfidibacter corallicola]QTD50153.1 M56 family metallopeptidase [Sulfidibacter corallicola]
MLVFLIDTTLKLTLIFGLAWLATHLTRKQASSLRHLIWKAAFLGMVLVLLGYFFLPRYELPLLPIPTAAETVVPATMPAALPHESPAVGHTTRAIWPWPAILLSLWGLGVFLVTTRFAVSLVQLMVLVKRAQKCEGPQWRELAYELAKTYRLKKPLDVRIASRTITPMTLGTLYPMVLLPQEARSWSDERLRLVLIHEIAHIKNKDFPIQLLVHGICALFWFHPLVWLAERHLTREREHASDDWVVFSGYKASTYAQHLLEIARVLRSGRPTPVGLGMAKISELEGRMIALLSDRADHGMLGLKTRIQTWSLSLLVCLPLADITPLALSTPFPLQAMEGSSGLIPIQDPRHVCMFADEVIENGPRVSRVLEIDGHRYYLATKECLESIARHSEIRFARDPMSGREVDKANAVLAVYAGSSRVAYFENEENLAEYNRRKAGMTQPERDHAERP